MRSKTLNSLENLLGRVLFVIFYTLLLSPWIRFVILDDQQKYFPQEMIWLSGLAIFSGGILLKLTSMIKRDLFSKIFTVLGYLGLTLLLSSLIRAFGFFEYRSLFVSGFLLIVGFRYERLFTREINFHSDFNRGIGVCFLTLLLKNRLQLEFSVEQIFLFFLSGVVCLIYQQYLATKAKLISKQRVWLGITFGTVFFIIIFATVLRSGFNDKLLSVLLAPIIFLVEVLWNIITKIILFLGMILSWLVTMIINFLKLFITFPEKHLGEQGMEGFQKALENTQELVDLADYAWILKIGLLVIAIIVVWYLSRKNRRVSEEVLGYEELRESTFNLSDLKSDLFQIWKSFYNRFKPTEKPSSIYDGNNLALKIREVYYQFLLALYAKAPFENHFTPDEYKRLLIQRYPVCADSLSKLTQIYESTRYSLEINPKHLQEIQLAMQKVITVVNSDTHMEVEQK